MREEQEGIAMTRKAGGTDEYKISHLMLYDSLCSSRRIMCEEESNREVDFQIGIFVHSPPRFILSVILFEVFFAKWV